MYENKFKNINELNYNELQLFLKLIADINKPLNLFALGGTAMILKNIKESTKDIDFITDANYTVVKEIFEIAGLKEISNSENCNIWSFNNTRIDIFYQGFILGIQLEKDWKELSEKILAIGKINLFILNWYDIIITKIARSEMRDIEDIKKILNAVKIDYKILKKRYFKIASVSLIADYKLKFNNIFR